MNHTPLNASGFAAATPTCALVLMGGGARTAYQVGVLKAVGELLEGAGQLEFPFPYLFGTSAGALNVAFLASHASSGAYALHELAGFWRMLRSSQVYRLDAPHWLPAHLLSAAWTLARQVKRHRALLDSLPLVDTVHKSISLLAIEDALDEGLIQVLGVTASSYTTGEHVTFFQTRPALQTDPSAAWQRPGRCAEFQPITVEHLMASAAIPFLFPAVPLWTSQGKAFFGDGSMRQISPLSGAIHFGARRVLAVGAGQPVRAALGAHPSSQPTAGTIAGHAMASVFHDTLAADVARAQRMSEALRLLPPDLAQRLPYHDVEVLAIQPSESLDELAVQHMQELPQRTRNTLQGLGVLGAQAGEHHSASALASYLLFEPGFVHALIELGQSDALAQKDAILGLLGVQNTPPNGCALPAGAQNRGHV